MQKIGTPYRKHDPGEPFDAIVVGSGIGGLTTAALLARHGGRRVLVLERHYMPGGFTHVFQRRGYEWDVGLHYIGAVDSRRSLTRRLFDHVSDRGLSWASMGEVYDRIVFDDKAYDFVAGPDRFRAGMKEYFPAEAAAIDRYVDLIRRIGRQANLYFAEKTLGGLLGAVAGPLLRAPFLRWARRTTLEALERITSDRQLLGVLTGQFGDYGLPPSQSSFAMHAMLVRHYLWGGSYPVGGSSAIARAIVPGIEAEGGKVLYYAEVSEILVEGGRAVGVRMADGAELRAPVVVSDAGIHNTYRHLLPRPVAESQGLMARLGKLQPSASHLCIYAGCEKTAAELGLPKHNLWIYPGYDHDANVAAFLDDPEAPLPVVYVSFPSAKDPSFEERFPGRATLELITLAPFERFAPWLDEPWRRRGDDYEAMKRRFAERMFAALDRQLPGLSAKIDYWEMSTPLSTRHFANYERGEIYGVDHSPDRFRQRFLRPRTPIRGLYLTGQDVMTAGIASALASGFLTASVVLGRNLLKAVESE
jgi:all-trans-retinol 13,14-reductase